MAQPTPHRGSVAPPTAPRLQSVRYVTVQKNMRLNQAQEKKMQSRACKHEMYEAAAGVTEHTILEQTFLYK